MDADRSRVAGTDGGSNDLSATRNIQRAGIDQDVAAVPDSVAQIGVTIGSQNPRGLAGNTVVTGDVYLLSGDIDVSAVSVACRPGENACRVKNVDRVCRDGNIPAFAGIRVGTWSEEGTSRNGIDESALIQLK